MDSRNLPGLINSIVIKAAVEIWQDKPFKTRAKTEEQQSEMGRLL